EGRAEEKKAAEEPKGWPGVAGPRPVWGPATGPTLGRAARRARRARKGKKGAVEKPLASGTSPLSKAFAPSWCPARPLDELSRLGRHVASGCPGPDYSNSGRARASAGALEGAVACLRVGARRSSRAGVCLPLTRTSCFIADARRPWGG